VSFPNSAAAEPPPPPTLDDQIPRIASETENGFCRGGGGQQQAVAGGQCADLLSSNGSPPTAHQAGITRCMLLRPAPLIDIDGVRLLKAAMVEKK